MKLNSRILFPLLLVLCGAGLVILYMCRGYVHSSPENIQTFFPRFGFVIAFIAAYHIWLSVIVWIALALVALWWARTEPWLFRNIMAFSRIIFKFTKKTWLSFIRHSFFQNTILLCSALLIALLLAELAVRIYFVGGDSVFTYNPTEMLSFVNEPQLKKDVYRTGHAVMNAYGYDSAWFDVAPPVRSYGNLRKEVALMQGDLKAEANINMMRVWNSRFVYEAYHNDSLFNQQAHFSTYRGQRVYVFESYDSGIYPVYRFFANSVLPNSSLRFNRFGFTGSDIDLEKPQQTIRIAFLGGSTTQQYPELSYAYTDYVELWLNAWAKKENLSVKFESINAGRVAQQSRDFAAIYPYELRPLQSDVVVYYEGRNQFDIEALSAARPSESFQKNFTYRLISRSILAQYLLHLTGISYYDCIEWQKPKTDFPPLHNEYNPNSDAADLPLQLPQIVRDLNQILSGMDTAHQSLVLCSFAMQVADSLLCRAGYNVSYTYWLHDFLGYRTTDIARYHHFQNRVFKHYASQHHIPFIDVAQMLDTMPYAFSDGIHMNPHGIKLHALAVFKDLVPLLSQKIKSGALPYKTGSDYAAHPYLTDSVRLVPLHP